MYSVLIPVSLALGTEENTSCPPLETYFSTNPSHLHYFTNHSSPSIHQIVVAALIESSWTLILGKDFSELDKNHDGVLERDEIESVIPPDFADAVFMNLDENGDEQISMEEWAKATMKLKLMRRSVVGIKTSKMISKQGGPGATTEATVMTVTVTTTQKVGEKTKEEVTN